jgi:hypothetical protein
LSVIIALAMVELIVTQPSVSAWIGQAAQIELAGGVITPDAAPILLARPADELRNSGSN